MLGPWGVQDMAGLLAPATATNAALGHGLAMGLRSQGSSDKYSSKSPG